PAPWRSALSSQWAVYWKRQAPDDIDAQLVAAVEGQEGATRKLSGKVLQKAAEAMPFLVGGSADLAPSNKTIIESGGFVVPSKGPGTVDFGGRNFRFGVREHAMGGMVNGLILYGSFLAYSGTFLVFSDYMRPPIRLAAMMKIPSVFVFTHDSIMVGEDGPTHQPIEHVSALRLIPNLNVFRPADGLETAMAWAWALTNRTGPTAIVLTRQGVPTLERPAGFDRKQIWKGGYVLSPPEGEEPDLIIIATGSEVWIAREAADRLRHEGTDAAVISMPCVERFIAQSEEYQDEVLYDRMAPTVVIEAGSTHLWSRFADSDGLILGKNDFGASAPYKKLAEEFGFTPEAVIKEIKAWLS
ncbi:transketolase C-terminal domain-containing protein, partial [Acidobacteriota bacterium]